MRSPPQPPAQYKPPSPPPVEFQEDQEQLPPPPLEEMEPPPSIPSRSSSKATPQPPGVRGRQIVNREPSVGSDRYEDIIVEARKRSQSRSRMGSRTSSVVDFRKSNSTLQNKLDLETVRASVNQREVAALDLDTKNNGTKTVESPVMSKRLPIISPPVVKKQEIIKPTPTPQQERSSKLVALDGNGNATAPILPTVPQVAKEPYTGPPDPLVKFFPKNIPDWFLITYTYSVVLIFILLIANVTPDGKLYIHFTAFWSLILYFVLEDEQVNFFTCLYVFI